jgi:CYTH domain-containing protein
MPSEHKYARVEWERRFLLKQIPKDAEITQVRFIVDRYIQDTRLRLRQISDRHGEVVFKLTQKIPEQAAGGRQGLITNFYVSKDEFDIVATLPAKILTKTRHSLPPFGIDVFEGALKGLIVAEAEFNSAEEAVALQSPAFSIGEVTNDLRFCGGSLAAATRGDLHRWLAEYGFELQCNSQLA